MPQPPIVVRHHAPRRYYGTCGLVDNESPLRFEAMAEILACFRINVANRDYHHLSQSATLSTEETLRIMVEQRRCQVTVTKSYSPAGERHRNVMYAPFG